MMDTKQKTILFLAGDGLTASVVEHAKELGYKTIVANFYSCELAPAKKVCDEAIEISITDIPQMLELIKEKHVDGIFTGYTDSHLPIYRELCEKAGLPYYITDDQILVTSNKLLFKELCRKNDVPTVTEYHINTDDIENAMLELTYPVMVKPCDSSGSRGCSVCSRAENLREAVENALHFSSSGKVIVEKYMERNHCDDIAIEYFFCEGKAYLAWIADRYVNIDPVTSSSYAAALVSPSRFIDDYYNNLDGKICRMFESIGLKNGTAFVQMFRDDEGFHVYEMGYRFGGGEGDLACLDDNGVDSFRAMLDYAVTGHSFATEKIENCTARYKKYYCDLNFACTAGTISRITGVDDVRKLPYVIHVTEMAGIGRHISAGGSLAQVAFRTLIKADTKEELKQYIDTVRDMIRIYDEKDELMMVHVTSSQDIK